MKSSPDEIKKVLILLDQTPRRLAAAAGGSSDEALHAAPDKKAWSAAEVLAHLRACADVWTHSSFAMLAVETPSLADIDERKWARVTGYAGLPFSRSLQTFTLQREELLRVLTALPPESWERTALIFERRHTVFSQARRMALHEDEHCAGLEVLLR